MKVEQLKTLTKLFEDYYFRMYSDDTLFYKYSYDTRIEIPNYDAIELAAISNNESAYYNKDYLLDFSKTIDSLIEDNATRAEIIDIFEDIDCAQLYAKQYNIKNMKITEAQHIIDRCNAAIIRLNTYMTEQHLLNQIESV